MSRRLRRWEARRREAEPDEVAAEPESCALCERSLGRRVEKHHVVPKSKGGTELVAIHPICHRKIHKVFTNTELARIGTIEGLKAEPEIRRFISWVRKRPVDFHSRTR